MNAPRAARGPHNQRSFTGPLPTGKRSAVLTYRYTPCYAMHVTFFEDRSSPARMAGAAGRHIRAADEHNRPPMTAAKRLGVVMDPIEAINYAKD